MQPTRVKRRLATITAATCLSGAALAAPAHADTTPSGANDWNCKPTAAHPYPVVLVHGTTANSALNWATLSPELAKAGYCVFAFDYGMTWVSGGLIGGLSDIAGSAKTMSAFVDRVLAATGTTKVDVVGHSQGGMMPNYYIKRLGGAAKVHTLIGLAPSNHGTTVNGLIDLVRAAGLLGRIAGFYNLLGFPAFIQQTAGSDFQKALFADGDTVPGVRYAVIETRHDIVVTPYTNAFLHGGDVTNVLLQDQCPGDPVGHAGLAFDSPAHQNVLNLLGPDIPGFKATCTGYGPAL
ncbi:alpha/beta fold hydrolase [Actinomadura barringtoniae]|uniref:Alpha/beta fold hydrolase n=1 Tax=Actinomadura barringtoniae TaxID=1427535 RepID=A0A939PF78_9ACTN|nr:alpha/beta fold hydrolase [Actinomadura barringtoniae]MBO2451112.1 alpha/beta fold hydrolase [Actinomadura barringtoniae]